MVSRIKKIVNTERAVEINVVWATDVVISFGIECAFG